MNNFYKIYFKLILDILINKSLDNISKCMQTIKSLFDIYKSTESDKDKNVFDRDLIKKVISLFPPIYEMGRTIT